MTLEEAEQLISQPRRWPGLSEADLEELIQMACWLIASRDDTALEAAGGRLYEHVVGTLGPDRRRRIIAGLAEMLEEFGRAQGTCPVTVLGYWMLNDPDFGVVATAALNAAQLLETSDDDPVAGARSVMELAHGGD